MSVAEDTLRSTLRMLTPAQLRDFCSGLEPSDLGTVERIVAEEHADHWRADPASTAAYLTRGDPEPIQVYPYTALLSRKFVDAVEGRSTRQIWNLPPQHGKSTLASQWGPAWALDHNPRIRIILSSYGDDLASENADAVREILRRHHQELTVILRPDRQERRRFKTGEGGGIHAAGIDSSITGFPADGVVLDDPFKNWQDAHSAARRLHVMNQFKSVLRMRQSRDDFWIIVVMTRWHELDLSATLLAEMREGEGEEWEHVRLAEVAEAPKVDSTDPILHAPDPLGREPGETLGRFSEAATAGRRQSATAYLWAGMHQQRPSPEEGTELLREWWRVADSPPPAYDDEITSWDMKLKSKESGDFVVGQHWGRTGATMWCDGQLRGQWNQPTTENAIALLAIRNPNCVKHYVENTGNGPEVMESLRAAHEGYVVSDGTAGLLGMTEAERDAVQAVRRRGMPGLIAVTVKGSKEVRARAEAGYLEAGNVVLAPRDAPFVGQLIDEAAAFPNGAHDDQVDAWSQAMSKLAHSEATIDAGRAGERVQTRNPRRRSEGPLVVSPGSFRR